MKKNNFVAKLLPISMLVSLLFTCTDDETYPIEPYIEIRSVDFISGASAVKGDTLAVSLFFRDGDMDLGLSPTMLSAPFHYSNYFVENAGIVHAVGTNRADGDSRDFVQPIPGFAGKLVTARTRRESGNNSLPPYNCIDYWKDSVYVSDVDKAIIGQANALKRSIQGGTYYTVFDTLLSEQNPYNTNIHVSFLVEQVDGSFLEMEFKSNCIISNFNARFPLMDLSLKDQKAGPFKITKETAKSGVITYAMKSVGFRPLFGGKRIKLRITIFDRALHASNTIESDIIEIPSN